MPPSRRALPALLAAGALLIVCGASPSLAPDDPPARPLDTASLVGAVDTVPQVNADGTGVSVDDGNSRVEVGPGGVRVETSGALVDVNPGSYVLVCANGVRVVVRAGEAPPCAPGPEQPEPPAPEEPGYPEPEPPDRKSVV